MQSSLMRGDNEPFPLKSTRGRVMKDVALERPDVAFETSRGEETRSEAGGHLPAAQRRRCRVQKTQLEIRIKWTFVGRWSTETKDLPRELVRSHSAFDSIVISGCGCIADWSLWSDSTLCSSIRLSDPIRPVDAAVAVPCRRRFHSRFTLTWF